MQKISWLTFAMNSALVLVVTIEKVVTTLSHGFGT